MPGVLLLLGPTYLGWDFKGEEVEAPGGQGLRTEEKNISSKWLLPGPRPPALLQPPQPVCTPCQQQPPAPGILFLSHAPPWAPGYPLSLACPLPWAWSPQLSPITPSLPCLSDSLLSAAQLPLMTPPPPVPPKPPTPPPKPSALTRTRSSNFLGFVSSFTRCCWSTAPWFRHLLMLSAGGWGACSELPLPWPPLPPQGSPGVGSDERRNKHRESFPSWVAFLFY